MTSLEEEPQGADQNEIAFNAREELRKMSTIATVQEIDFSTNQLSHYLRLLQDPINSLHFNPVPKDVGELMDEFKIPALHGIVGKNLLGDTVGYSKLRDSDPGRHDTWIEGLVIEKDLQNKGDGGHHVGSQFLKEIIGYAFSTPTYDGRQRTKLDAGVIKDIPYWQRASGVFRRCGFKFIGTLEDQVDLLGGVKDVELFELKRSAWEEISSVLNRPSLIS